MLAPDKAVEILKLAISDPDLVGAVDLMDAQKLATEALEFCIKYKAMIIQLGHTLRLGENSQ